MSGIAAAPPSSVGGSHWGPGRVLGAAAGSLIALIGTVIALSGLALVIVDLGLRDHDGFINTSTRHFDTPTYALTTGGVQLGDLHGGAGDWAIENLDGRVRIRAALQGGAPVFVGIARKADLDRYLRGVAHARIKDFGHHRAVLRTVPGTSIPRAPSSRFFWVASASGPGAQTVTWKVDTGRWEAVVMRSDAARGVVADIRAGGNVPKLLWLGIGLLALGCLAFAAGAGVIVAVGPRAAAAAAAPPTAMVEPAPSAHAVAVRAHVDPGLSRWMWLVKWVLVVPHLIVLAFLWVAFAFTAVAGVVALMATGRYPRALHDFHVGVMRWTWRVEFYANGAFATDRYPPFSLDPDPSYPADLEIPYVAHPARWLSAVKWLLAVPHWIVLGALIAGGWWWTDGRAPGLLPVLVIFSVIWLTFTGRYPADLFRLIVGIHRWTLRTIAYAIGMVDEYPPFRLDR